MTNQLGQLCPFNWHAQRDRLAAKGCAVMHWRTRVGWQVCWAQHLEVRSWQGTSWLVDTAL